MRTSRRAPVVHLRIDTEFTVTNAVLKAGKLAEEAGLDAGSRQMLATAVSELVRNIVKYAGRGSIKLTVITHKGVPGIQAEVVDQGPGIEDLELAMRDHVSTSGTLGLGLPGVKRMMDEFEIRSEPGKGTRVVIRKWSSKR